MYTTAMGLWILSTKTINKFMSTAAYAGKELPKHVTNHVHEKGCLKSLTAKQKESNRIKTKTRARIEHVFGFMTMTMHGLTVRSIGIERAKFNIGLTNLVYNMCMEIISKFEPKNQKRELKNSIYRGSLMIMLFIWSML